MFDVSLVVGLLLLVFALIVRKKQWAKYALMGGAALVLISLILNWSDFSEGFMEGFRRTTGS